MLKHILTFNISFKGTKVEVFWVVMPCIVTEGYQCFRGQPWKPQIFCSGQSL